MNVLVIEQEKAKAKKIRDILSGIDDSIHVVEIADSVSSAAEWLNRNAIPDIILANNLLVNEIEKNGGREIKATVTFSTATEELNLRALRYKTVRYFLNNHSLRLSDENTIYYPSSRQQANLATFKERFLVRQGQKFLSIAADQVAYFFSEERFIFLRTFDNQKFLLEYRIEQLEKVLSPSHFFRINRSFIISIPTVKEIHAYFGNRLKLYLSPSADRDVIVSRKRVSDFKEWLGK